MVELNELMVMYDRMEAVREEGLGYSAVYNGSADRLAELMDRLITYDPYVIPELSEEQGTNKGVMSCAADMFSAYDNAMRCRREFDRLRENVNDCVREKLFSLGYAIFANHGVSMYHDPNDEVSDRIYLNSAAIIVLKGEYIDKENFTDAIDDVLRGVTNNYQQGRYLTERARMSSQEILQLGMGRGCVYVNRDAVKRIFEMG